ncbi:MAG: beta-lactamase family protein [Clostridiales Family XIII bacterium]|nr:beta-lactamase family protein [Clostridiales Family XIII bacterium]
MGDAAMIENLIDESYACCDLPGLAVGIKVAEDSHLPSAGLNLSSVRGFSDFESKTPLDADGIFHMASVAKLFVAEGIMQLARDGRLRIDDRLIDLMPRFSLDDPRCKEITVGQTLSHTSGIPDIKDYHWTEPEADRDALRRFVASSDVTGPPLLRDPGKGAFQYSNIGYDILGAVIAELSGTTFEDFMNERIFAELGMRDSTFLTFLRAPQGRESAETFERLRAALDPVNLRRYGMVMPHRRDENRRIVRQAYYPYNRAHAPSSSLTSTLRDIKKWGDFHIARWEEDTWQEQAPVPNSDEKMGFGWFMREQNGYRLYGHEGADDGFRSSFWICPALKAQITVLANIDRAPVKRIGKRLFDALTVDAAATVEFSGSARDSKQ